MKKENLTGLRWRPSGELRRYWVYILSNVSMTLYTGVTDDVNKRTAKHKSKRVPGFTSRYHFDRLVYFECFNDPKTAIAREKQIKGLTRKKKLALVKTMNREWKDLSLGDFTDSASS